MPPRRRPRGHIETLPSGTFRARVYAGIDPLTKRRRYLLETAPSYDAAEKALAGLRPIPKACSVVGFGRRAPAGGI